MKLWDFLPFEISYINSLKTIDEIKNILLFDLQKKYRSKFEELNIHLWDDIFLKDQHYYLKFLKTDTNDNKNKIRIFSRNNMFLFFVYIFFMIIGIYGLIKMILEGDYIGIIFLLLWILFIFIISNFIWKKDRYDEIKYIEKLL
jgi:hypothetical protein